MVIGKNGGGMGFANKSQQIKNFKTETAIKDFKECYTIAKNKIKLKLWSVDYARGYLSCYLNNVLTVNDYEYNEYAKLIDELAI